MKNPSIILAMPGPSLNVGTHQAIMGASQRGLDIWETTCHFGAWDAFNCCWADALNAAAAGEASHFAMIHSDVQPELGWLDVQLDESELLKADCLSVAIPIKDAFGNSSTALARRGNRWQQRRLTMTEIHNLPESFSLADVLQMLGLEDDGNWQLLVNDGLMLCDLRSPVFHQVDENGRAKTDFGWNAGVFRDPDGVWRSRRESEDWFFSRGMAELGAKVYCTRKVKLTHAGGFDYPNDFAWGRFKQDEMCKGRGFGL